MCLGIWSKLGYIYNGDIMQAVALPDVCGKEDELSDGWDNIP